jgi:hypothetical protein
MATVWPAPTAGVRLPPMAMLSALATASVRDLTMVMVSFCWTISVRLPPLVMLSSLSTPSARFRSTLVVSSCATCYLRSWPTSRVSSFLTRMFMATRLGKRAAYSPVSQPPWDMPIRWMEVVGANAVNRPSSQLR